MLTTPVFGQQSELNHIFLSVPAWGLTSLIDNCKGLIEIKLWVGGGAVVQDVSYGQGSY